MAEPTYLFRNCAIGISWFFHRLCKDLRPYNVLHEYLRSVFFTRHCYSFRTIRFFLYGILLVSTWKTYFHKIFAMKTGLKAF